MRKITISLLCLVLLAPTMALGDGTLSLVHYSTAHDYNCGVVTHGSFLTLELGVFDPVNTDFGAGGTTQAVSNVGGFRCRIDAEPGIFILGVDPVTPGQNVATNSDLVINFDTPVPVVTGKTVLATVDVWFGGETSFELPEEQTLPCHYSHNTGLHVSAPAAYGGEAVIVDADDPVGGRVPVQVTVGRDFAFLLLQDPTVPVVADSWGALKALYR